MILMRMSYRCIATLCLALLAAGQPAFGATGQWGIGELMRSLAQVEHSQARFVERKYLKVLNAPLELSGTLTYTRPGQLEKRTLKPKPETLELDGDRLTLTNPAGKRRAIRLQDYPVLWGFIESIRATLGGDIKALERFYRVELEGTSARWRLFLVPRERKMKDVISLIRLDGSQARVERIEVQEARGDRTVMKILEDGS
ncbi:MAG: LolA-related protein [Betaproteobacteria bacterium]